MKKKLGILPALMFVSACASIPADSPQDVRAIIDRHNADAERWYAAEDVHGLMSLFAEEAWQMPPNLAPLVGREAIRQFWSQAMQWGDWDFDLQAQDVDVSGPLAVERGKYVLRFTAGANSPFPSFVDRGNYLVEWRREADGQWRIVADAPVSEIPCGLDER